MIPAIEEVRAMLSELIDEIPEDYFKDLNGGISLLDQVCYDTRVPDRHLLVLGQYRYHHQTGRMIVLFYGSLSRSLGGASEQIWRRELRRVLRHELTHHLESLAGEHELELFDAAKLKAFMEGTSFTAKEEHRML